MLIDYVTKNGIYGITYHFHNKCKSYQISLFNEKKIWIVTMKDPFSNEYENNCGSISGCCQKTDFILL